MLLSEFDYALPPDLIAQEPLPDRAGARMLVVDRKTGRWEDRVFRDFPSYIKPGDCLIQNDSRVFPSRLLGQREGAAGKLEIFLTRQIAGDIWAALVKPGRHLRAGERVVISPELSLEILEQGERGERTVRLQTATDLFETLERLGHVPLPPYIRRADNQADRERYQTVYAQERGSVAAPTAGLHFTEEILEQCRAAGAEIARVTLHVGLGTFQPIRVTSLADVKLHAERFAVPDAALEAMDRAQRVMAIGTTSVRAIESDPAQADTQIFIAPGFRFQRTGALLTNFHLPQSSLLVLVAAFAGRDLALDAYRYAVSERYRFFSYGDCMLVL